MVPYMLHRGTCNVSWIYAAVSRSIGSPVKDSFFSVRAVVLQMPGCFDQPVVSRGGRQVRRCRSPEAPSAIVPASNLPA